MRFKLIFRRLHGNTLPINYQYELSSCIYKIFNSADTSFSDWLHNKGFVVEGRQYKLFTFAPLHVPRYQVQGDRLKLLSDTVYWHISFYLHHPATENFIKGLFQSQRFELGDQQSRTVFEVQSIEMESPQMLRSTRIKFRAVSPVCVSTMNDRMLPQYLSPLDEGYEDLFFDNLIRKYRATCVFENRSSDSLAFADAPEFKLLSEPKSRLITIKANTPQESRVRGYTYDFELYAPYELMEVGFYAGMGSANSVGFGFVKVL